MSHEPKERALRLRARGGFLFNPSQKRGVARGDGQGHHAGAFVAMQFLYSVGNLGHGVGPSIALWNPRRVTFEIVPSNLLSIELFAYTAIPEWGGAKLRVPLEDDAVVTERGAEWLYPANRRLLLIKSEPNARRIAS